MKKVVLMLALSCAMVGASAQIATENSKLLDNVSVGVDLGVQTPLDFNSVFPLNTTVGVNLRKDLTPVVGLQLEGVAVLNDNHFSNLKTTVKATNVGLNGIVNLSNLIGGYKGSPRAFEVSTVTGIGWLHSWNTSENSLTGKTGLDLAFNLGKAKNHSIVLTPAVYWNLHKFCQVSFDKRGAQLGLGVGYVYKFKTSNGTHNFKIHDVGAMTSDITRLQGENEALKGDIADMAKALKDKETLNRRLTDRLERRSKVVTNRAVVGNKWVVQFEKNKSTLTSAAIDELNKIQPNTVVNVVGSASPEGKPQHNQRLSEMRAATVSDYLTKRGVKVNVVKGVGAETNASNRLAIVTAE